LRQIERFSVDKSYEFVETTATIDPAGLRLVAMAIKLLMLKNMLQMKD